MTADALRQFDAIMPAPFGALGIRIRATAICGIDFLPPGTPPHAPQSAIAELAWSRLQAYLDDPDSTLDLPTEANGTPHQLRVWDEIRAIPRGRVLRYGQLSAKLGSSARAVGQACGANPLPLIVPCHRVVSAAGLGGFANARDGFLLDTKHWLLRHEGVLLA